MPIYRATLHLSYSVSIEVEEEAEDLGTFLARTETRAMAGAYDECAFAAIRDGECHTADAEIITFERRSTLMPEHEA